MMKAALFTHINKIGRHYSQQVAEKEWDHDGEGMEQLIP